MSDNISFGELLGDVGNVPLPQDKAEHEIDRERLAEITDSLWDLITDEIGASKALKSLRSRGFRLSETELQWLLRGNGCRDDCISEYERRDRALSVYGF